MGPLTALKIHHNSKYREKLKYPASSLSPKTKNRFPLPFNSNIQNHYRKPSDLDSSPSFQHHCLKTKRTFQTTLEFPRSYPHLFSFSHLLYSCLHLFLSLFAMGSSRYIFKPTPFKSSWYMLHKWSSCAVLSLLTPNLKKRTEPRIENSLLIRSQACRSTQTTTWALLSSMNSRSRLPSFSKRR